MRNAGFGFALVAAMQFVALPRTHAQDVPGIEICTVEKTMERRTSCLQSNVDFLKRSLDKAQVDNVRKLDAANRQIDTLKAVVASLQKTIDELQAEVMKAKKSPEAAPSPIVAPSGQK